LGILNRLTQEQPFASAGSGMARLVAHSMRIPEGELVQGAAALSEFYHDVEETLLSTLFRVKTAAPA
jgi:hypothetical protein